MAIHGTYNYVLLFQGFVTVIKRLHNTFSIYRMSLCSIETERHAAGDGLGLRVGPAVALTPYSLHIFYDTEFLLHSLLWKGARFTCRKNDAFCLIME